MISSSFVLLMVKITDQSLFIYGTATLPTSVVGAEEDPPEEPLGDPSEESFEEPCERGVTVRLYRFPLASACLRK